MNDVSPDPLTTAEAFDRGYQALRDELAESPLPGARYAWEVVGRRGPAIKLATLDASRTPDLDRLRAIEAAARAVIASETPWAESELAALRAALALPSNGGEA